MAAELDYVPLPASLIEQVRATWKAQIKGVAGDVRPTRARLGAIGRRRRACAVS